MFSKGMHTIISIGVFCVHKPVWFTLYYMMVQKGGQVTKTLLHEVRSDWFNRVH